MLSPTRDYLTRKTTSSLKEKNLKKEMDKLIYPNVEKIIGHNKIILIYTPIKRADETKVLDKKKIEQAIKECKNSKGDIHDKAVILLK